VITRSSESVNATPLCVVTEKCHSVVLCTKGFLYDFYVGVGFIQIMQEKISEFRTHGILIDRKRLRRNCVLTEEKLDDIGLQLENSRKLLCQLALQTVFS
jgi:hypothetical protein